MLIKNAITDQQEPDVGETPDDLWGGIQELVVALQLEQTSNLADHQSTIGDAKLSTDGEWIHPCFQKPVQLHAAVDGRKLFRGSNPGGNRLPTNDIRHT